MGRIPNFRNEIIMGGPLLDEVKNLPSVKSLINEGLRDLSNKKFEPGEYFKGKFTMSNITGPDGQRIYKHIFNDFFTKRLENNYFFSAENFLGSYGFSMRVAADGKQLVICVYDSKSLGSLANHKAWAEKQLPDLAPTYQRYLWRVPIPKY